MDETYPYSNDDTSFAAAQENSEQRSSQRRRMLALFEDKRDYGCTDDELMTELSLNSNSVHPRRWQLCKDGRLYDSGKRRSTRTGFLATVWVKTEYLPRT